MIEIDICEVCDNLIGYDSIPTHEYIECSECGTQYQIIEVWNSEDNEYNRYLELVE